MRGSPAGFCRHGAPARVASSIPEGHGSSSCTARAKRSPPTGGFAYGMPAKRSTPAWSAVPRRVPCVRWTVGDAA
eukprot:scaffold52098_cov37-Tisochrysis_lutea.AAC.2